MVKVHPPSLRLGRPYLSQVPVSIIYGEHDWMDPRAGQRVAAAVARDRGRLSATDCQVWFRCTPLLGVAAAACNTSFACSWCTFPSRQRYHISLLQSKCCGGAKY